MSFFKIINEAVNDMIQNGFDSQTRLDIWVQRIKQAATLFLVPEHKVKADVEKALRGVFNRLVVKDGLISSNVSRFTIDKLTPKMRADLDRRIMASANLIKYNRINAINSTLQRFEGWATSIPKGGTRAADKIAEKESLKKDMASVRFKERRVIIDQSHKLTASINEIVALEAGAIAFKWRSHWKQQNYDYREDHKERDEKIYMVRGSWADQAGYVKPVHGYYDEITAAGEEVYCRCYLIGIYNMPGLPDEFLTQKYKNKLN